MDFDFVANAGAITVAIHNKESNGNPAATARATLTGTPATGVSTFTCDATNTNNDCALDTNTSYFVHVASSVLASDSVSTTLSDDETLTPSSTGWSIGNALSYQTGGSWALYFNSVTLKMKVTATRNPSLTASNVAATTATLTIAGYSGSLVLQAHEHRRDVRRPRERDKQEPHRPDREHVLHLQGPQRLVLRDGQPDCNGIRVHHAGLNEHPERG